MNEPILIIRKSDLEKYRFKIEETLLNEKDEAKREDYTHLAYALQAGTTIFPEIEIVLLKVEFTSSIRRVMAELDKLKIDYRLNN